MPLPYLKTGSSGAKKVYKVNQHEYVADPKKVAEYEARKAAAKDRVDPIAANFYGASVVGPGGRSNMYKGGVGSLGTTYGNIPIYGALAAAARESVGWNRGRESYSDFFGLDRSRAVRQREMDQLGIEYTKPVSGSVQAMRQKMERIMAAGPKELLEADRHLNPYEERKRVLRGSYKQNVQPLIDYQQRLTELNKWKGNKGYINPNSALAKQAQDRYAQAVNRLGGEAAIIGKEQGRAGGNLRTVQKGIGQRLDAAVANYDKLRQKYQGSEGYAGMRQGQRTQQSYQAWINKQRRALEGYAPTEASVRMRENLKSVDIDTI